MLSATVRTAARRAVPTLRSAIPKIALAQFASTRTFIATPARFNAATEVKEILREESKLSAALPNELEPAYQEFLNANGYKVIAKEGTSNVQLVKEKGDETIRIFFDIDEVTDIPMGEEQEASVDFDQDVEALDSLLCNIKVLIEKPALNDGMFMNLFLQNTEEAFMVDFINYQSDVKSLLNDQILANNEFVDKVKYQGPRFSDLDPALQTALEQYLQTKGLDSELADFIVAYSEYKEENEYRQWLKNLEKFI